MSVVRPSAALVLALLVAPCLARAEVLIIDMSPKKTRPGPRPRPTCSS